MSPAAGATAYDVRGSIPRARVFGSGRGTDRKAGSEMSSKYWRVKKETALWDECMSWMNEYNVIAEKRRALARRLLGRRRKTVEVVAGPELCGFGYATGKYPRTVPHLDIEMTDDKHCGPHYRAKKKTAGGKKLANEMRQLRQISTARFCKSLGIADCDFSGAGLRFNNPGLRYRLKGNDFYLKTHDDLVVKCGDVERISDLEWEALDE